MQCPAGFAIMLVVEAGTACYATSKVYKSVVHMGYAAVLLGVLPQWRDDWFGYWVFATLMGNRYPQ